MHAIIDKFAERGLRSLGVACQVFNMVYLSFPFHSLPGLPGSSLLMEYKKSKNQVKNQNLLSLSPR